MLSRCNLVHPQGYRFPLVELVILAAIGLALVGVSVPMFQKGVAYSPIAYARQDLDTIRNALSLYEQQNGRFTGVSLERLCGRYLQEVPKDPWNHEYIVSGDTGLVITLGADGEPGGIDDEADMIVRFRP